jgi:hypothetical protein
MRTAALAGCLALLAACTPAPEQAEAPPPAPPPAAPAATLADFAGTWNTTATLTGVTAPVESQLTGSADGSTWTMTLAGRDPIPLQASIVGDSLVAVSAEYESILRPGVRVTTRTAVVRSGADLVGNLIATYKMAGGDSVVTGTVRSTRAPQ